MLLGSTGFDVEQMIHVHLSRTARRLHVVVIGLLTLQLIGNGSLQPLVWGGSLLTLMAALKIAESRRPQDLQRAALAELIVLGVLAVMNSELSVSLLQMGTALLVIAAVLCQESGERQSLRRILTRSLQLGLAALPMLVMLFVLMPRIGPFWTMPGQNSGRSGLSPHLDTGMITRLVQDPAPALRIAYLEGDPPPPWQRYWRVVVLDRFDGKSWNAPPLPERPTAGRGTDNVPPAQQIWMTEPSEVTSLPWPGEGVLSDAALSINSDGVVVDVAGGGSRRRRYGISTSQVPPAWRRWPPNQEDLLFPAGSNPKLEAMALSWARDLPPAARVTAAQHLFRTQQLRYTLSPPQLPDQAPLDRLLFETKEGFCEHFASAFTALMRAAGVPARVVIGYQGGEWIADDRWGHGFLDVRQRDAHAWSEIWLNETGWISVDPTGWVAPRRITDGIVAGLSDNPDDLARLGIRRQWSLQLSQIWTKLELNWTRWVLDLDAERQGSLLGRWRDWQGLLLMMGVAIMLVPAVWWLQRQQRSTGADVYRRRLDHCLDRLAILGLQPEPGQSLPDFITEIGHRNGDLLPALTDLSKAYEELRFAGKGQRRESLRKIKRAQRDLLKAAGHGRRKMQ